MWRSNNNNNNNNGSWWLLWVSSPVFIRIWNYKGTSSYIFSLQEVFSRVLQTENTPSIPISGALVSQHHNDLGRSQSKNGRKGGGSNSEIRTQDFGVVVVCHYCNKPGHMKRDCWRYWNQTLPDFDRDVGTTTWLEIGCRMWRHILAWFQTVQVHSSSSLPSAEWISLDSTNGRCYKDQCWSGVSWSIGVFFWIGIVAQNSSGECIWWCRKKLFGTLDQWRVRL